VNRLPSKSSFLPNSNLSFAVWQNAIARSAATSSPYLIASKPESFPGDQISGTGFTVFKVRVKNSDIRKGKRAGYRVIYQVIEPTSVCYY
jgi:hypothetical protein